MQKVADKSESKIVDKGRMGSKGGERLYVHAFRCYIRHILDKSFKVICVTGESVLLGSIGPL